MINKIAYGTYYFLFDKIYDNDFILSQEWYKVKQPNKIFYAMEEMIIKSIEKGIRIFDTAKWYKTEDVLGRAIKRAIDRNLVKRKDLTIITKLDYYGLEEVENDIVLIHSPVRNNIKNTWQELDLLVKKW